MKLGIIIVCTITYTNNCNPLIQLPIFLNLYVNICTSKAILCCSFLLNGVTEDTDEGGYKKTEQRLQSAGDGICQLGITLKLFISQYST